MQEEKTLVVLLGPTGVGKTELSLRLAEKLKSPIVSADSRQFYRELKIGTATPTDVQLKRVAHYFIANKSIAYEPITYLYKRYKIAAKRAILAKVPNTLLALFGFLLATLPVVPLIYVL